LNPPPPGRLSSLELERKSNSQKVR